MLENTGQVRNPKSSNGCQAATGPIGIRTGNRGLNASMTTFAANMVFLDMTMTTHHPLYTRPTYMTAIGIAGSFARNWWTRHFHLTRLSLPLLLRLAPHLSPRLPVQQVLRRVMLLLLSHLRLQHLLRFAPPPRLVPSSPPSLPASSAFVRQPDPPFPFLATVFDFVCYRRSLHDEQLEQESDEQFVARYNRHERSRKNYDVTPNTQLYLWMRNHANGKYYIRDRILLDEPENVETSLSMMPPACIQYDAFHNSFEVCDGFVAYEDPSDQLLTGVDRKPAQLKPGFLWVPENDVDNDMSLALSLAEKRLVSPIIIIQSFLC